MKCFIKNCKKEVDGWVRLGDLYIAWCQEHEEIADKALAANDDGKSLKEIYDSNK